MSTQPYPYAFEGRLVRHGVGRARQIWYKVVFLPASLVSELPFSRFPRLRVDAEIGECSASGAWLPSGDGRHYFIVAPPVIKAMAAQVGDTMPFRFAVADQDAVDVPEALQRALVANPNSLTAWNKLSPGKRRGLTYPIHAARTEATRADRVHKLIVALGQGRAGLSTYRTAPQFDALETNNRPP